jgi:flagellar biosynthetic protein FliR
MLSFSEAQLMQWLSPLLWPLLRIVSLFMTAPVLSLRSVPTRVKIALAVLTALAAAPSLPAMQTVSINSPQAFEAVLQQIMIGASMGFAARIVFAATEFAGELIGLQMGLNYAGFFNPASGSTGTATSRFFGTMSSWLFVMLNGHLLMTAALIQSFQSFPVGQSPLSFITQTAPYLWGAELFQLGLWIALPLMGVLLFVNLVLGVISRVASQINIFAVGFPITLGAGLLGIVFMLPMLEQPFTSALERMLALFR